MDSIHSKNKKPIKFVKRQVPEHPYCTNWPMNEEKIKLELHPIVPKELVGWFGLELPKFVMTRLQSYIEVAKNNPISYNEQLAGNISRSLELKDKDDWFFQTVLAPCINGYSEYYPAYVNEMTSFLTEETIKKAAEAQALTECAPFILKKFWVNFQKQHEFNPHHNHSGVWSFVVWVKIPTDWREQHALPFVNHSGAPIASDFEFVYTTMLGGFGKHSYFLDQESEGMMLFFPAKLKHAVYPFYECDEERISISGNIMFDNP